MRENINEIIVFSDGTNINCQNIIFNELTTLYWIISWVHVIMNLTETYARSDLSISQLQIISYTKRGGK